MYELRENIALAVIWLLTLSALAVAIRALIWLVPRLLRVPLWCLRFTFGLKECEATVVEKIVPPPTKQELAKAIEEEHKESLRIIDSMPWDDDEKEAAREEAKRSFMHRISEIVQ